MIGGVFEAVCHEPRTRAAWWVLLLLSAARDKSQALRMEKRVVDSERSLWIIPQEKTKAGRALALLSPLGG